MTDRAANSGKNYDFLIIGGGVIGLALARELHRKGIRRIAVADRGEIGKEASYAAAGMLAPHAETDCDDLFYRFCLKSLSLYDAFAADLLNETGIDIELNREGTLYAAFDERSAAELDRRFAWQNKEQMPVERLTARELAALEPHLSPNVLQGLYFREDWQVENRKLLSALRRFAELNNVVLLENLELDRLILENGVVRGALGGIRGVSAGNTVLATGAWTSFINTGKPRVPAVMPVKGQMICFRPKTRILSKVVYGPNGYLVPRADGRLLVGATVEDAGFNKEVTPDGIDLLRSAAAEIVPAVADLEIVESWAGLRPRAADGLPVLGGVEGLPGLHLATAHFRNGILLAPLTAEIIAAAVCGGTSSEYTAAFGAGRFSSISVGV